MNDDDDPFAEPQGPEPLRIQLSPETPMIKFTVSERGAWAMLMPAGHDARALLQREDMPVGLTTVHASVAVGVKLLAPGRYVYRSCDAKLWHASILAIDAAASVDRDAAWARGDEPADTGTSPPVSPLDLSEDMAKARAADEAIAYKGMRRSMWLRSQKAARARGRR